MSAQKFPREASKERGDRKDGKKKNRRGDALYKRMSQLIYIKKVARPYMEGSQLTRNLNWENIVGENSFAEAGVTIEKKVRNLNMFEDFLEKMSRVRG